MKIRIAFLLLFALTLGCCAVGAQQWFEKKEWPQWSKEEARKMLEKSPWAEKWEIAAVLTSNLGDSTYGTGRETTPKVFYVIQLRSALPIRQGVARQLHIDNKYDKMGENEKKSLDASIEQFLNRKYEDVIVVHVVYGSNVQMYERELARIWQGIPDGTVPVNTRLTTSKGKIVEPLRFVSPKSGIYEFELIFPRVVDGQPLISPEDKSIRIEFPQPNVAGITAQRVFVEFKIEKMSYKGILEF